MPHASLRILHITGIAGNDVNMDMENTLSGRCSYIDTDIVTIGLKFLIEKFFLLAYQIHTGLNLFRRQLEKAGHVAARYYQRMSRANRKAVAGAVCEPMIQ